MEATQRPDSLRRGGALGSPASGPAQRPAGFLGAKTALVCTKCPAQPPKGIPRKSLAQGSICKGDGVAPAQIPMGHSGWTAEYCLLFGQRRGCKAAGDRGSATARVSLSLSRPGTFSQFI